MRLRRLPSILAVVIATSSIVHADAAADAKAKAEALFKEGRDLAKDGKWAAACPKFEESQKLDWAPGTQINIAVCHARIGKNAKAYGELVEALSIAEKTKRKDREKICRDELAALEPKIARLTVLTAAPPPGLFVTIDGEALPPAALGAPRVVDPGMHLVKATAAGKIAWEANVALVGGDKKVVDIPELTDATESPSVVSPTPITPAPAEAMASPAAAPAPNATANVKDESLSGGPRTAGWIVGGAGLVALGIGAGFALRASSLDSQKDDLAAQGDAAGANDKAGAARSAQMIGRIAVGVGIVSVGVGLYLLLSPKLVAEPERKSATWSLFPSVGPGFGGVGLGGGW
jgi:hypothetical protein